MTNELSPSAHRVQTTLLEHGFNCTVLELSESTRTAKEAAQAVGCQVGQIVKSLVFKGKKSQTPILVVASGSNRVNEAKISKMVSESIKMAHADFVRRKTGFAIGGVPPLGHFEKLVTFIDEDLFEYDDIWAAAGNPRALFKLTPDNLVEMTGGKVVSVI
ncbi:MAG: YbaK/EbsC family protein [Desulfobacterales bacterium]|nr:MAG: YbaK/EbsC family protein [Desulfobacterales bacterium]